MHKRIAVIAIFLCSACAQIAFSAVSKPKQSQGRAVVFDIDGTLTPSVLAVFEARKDAAKAVRTYADKGYRIIYLTARVRWLSSGISSWLMRHEFPEGSVYVAQTSEERQHPDIYKTKVLQSLLAVGWQIDYAYGDSSTDLNAYAAVGIPKAHVFALRRKGQSRCQIGSAVQCLTGWSEHLAFITAAVPSVKSQ